MGRSKISDSKATTFDDCSLERKVDLSVSMVVRASTVDAALPLSD